MPEPLTGDIRERIARAIEGKRENPDLTGSLIGPTTRGYYQGLDDGLLEAAEIARATPAWIAVADGLPDPGINVVALCLGGPVLAYTNPNYDRDWVTAETGDELPTGSVSHWAVIPPLPTEPTP